MEKIRKLKRFSNIFSVKQDLEATRSNIQLAITQTKEYGKLDSEHQVHALLIINEELEREKKTKFGILDIAKIAKRIEKRLNEECPVHVSAKTEDTN
jgi:hypothetical protein